MKSSENIASAKRCEFFFPVPDEIAAIAAALMEFFRAENSPGAKLSATFSPLASTLLGNDVETENVPHSKEEDCCTADFTSDGRSPDSPWHVKQLRSSLAAATCARFFLKRAMQDLQRRNFSICAPLRRPIRNCKLRRQKSRILKFRRTSGGGRAKALTQLFWIAANLQLSGHGKSI